MKILGLNNTIRLDKIIAMLKDITRGMIEPASTQIITQFGKDPFLILISCLLSLRTKDAVTLPASQRLFAVARTPQDILDCSLSEIEKLIYPVAFYRKRAHNLHEVCHALLDNFGGCVPKTEKELLTLPGVGRKTANLVLGYGFDIPALCVDTHVHRIANRLGLVKTKTPDETEIALQQVVKKEHWIEFNRLLVVWGQNVCVPISPFCSRCPLAGGLCPQVGVGKKR